MRAVTKKVKMKKNVVINTYHITNVVFLGVIQNGIQKQKQQKYLSFPWYEKEEHQLKYGQKLYIGRKCEHGSEWKPDKHHRICGLHFYSGKYSNDPQDPDYVPSWFQNKGTIQGVEQVNVKLPKNFLDSEGKIENQNI